MSEISYRLQKFWPSAKTGTQARESRTPWMSVPWCMCTKLFSEVLIPAMEKQDLYTVLKSVKTLSCQLLTWIWNVNMPTKMCKATNNALKGATNWTVTKWKQPCTECPPLQSEPLCVGHSLGQDRSMGQSLLLHHTSQSSGPCSWHICAISKAIWPGLLGTQTQSETSGHVWLWPSDLGDSCACGLTASSRQEIESSHTEWGPGCTVGGQGGPGQTGKPVSRLQCGSRHCRAGGCTRDQSCHQSLLSTRRAASDGSSPSNSSRFGCTPQTLWWTRCTQHGLSLWHQKTPSTGMLLRPQTQSCLLRPSSPFGQPLLAVLFQLWIVQVHRTFIPTTELVKVGICHESGQVLGTKRNSGSAMFIS